MDKYELTKEAKIIHTSSNRKVILHRIKALKDFGQVKVGDLGGWIESESNLSQEGNCWVNNEAHVYDNARIDRDAVIYGQSKIYGSAIVTDDSIVDDNVKIYGNAIISGNAYICKKAKIFEHAAVHDSAFVSDSVKIYGYASVRDNVEVLGDAIIHGDAEVSGMAIINEHADVSVTNHCVTIGPVANEEDYITFYHGVDGKIYANYHGSVCITDDIITLLNQLYNLKPKTVKVIKLAIELVTIQINDE